MPVYLAAGAAAFFYLMMLPVRAGAAWKSGGPLRLGITIGPMRFTARAEIRHEANSGPIARMTGDRSGRVHTLPLLQQPPDRDALRSGLQSCSAAAKYLLRRIRPWKIRAHCRLALPNAAHTALLYGLFTSILFALRSARPSLPLEASVSADFRSLNTQLDFYGILSCRLGHIMAAALILSRDQLARRIHTWTTSSRLKAS